MFPEDSSRPYPKMRRSRPPSLARFLAFTALAALLLILLISSYPELPGGYRARDLLESREERGERLFERKWRARLRGFARQKPGENSLILLGSSTLEGFPATHLLREPGTIVNRAIGGEDLEHLRRRLEQSLPKRAGGFILYLGAVDFYRDHRSPPQIAADAEAILGAIRRRFPLAPIALIGVLPSRKLDAQRLVQLRELHRLIEAQCRLHGVVFVSPLRAPLFEEGRLAPSLSRDSHHLNEAGYRVLLPWLRQTAPAIASRLH